MIYKSFKNGYPEDHTEWQSVTEAKATLELLRQGGKICLSKEPMFQLFSVSNPCRASIQVYNV
jgi:hypothetical protein